MPDTLADLPLAAEFPAATRDAWKAAAEKALKGRDFERTLIGKTYDGIRIEPLYAKAEAAGPVPGRAATPWRIAARADHPEAAAAKDLALADLAGGADALTLVVRGSRSARGFGLEPSAAALAATLDGVMLDLIAIRLDPGPEGASAIDALMAVLRGRGHDLAALDLDLGLDPVGDAAASGRLDPAWGDELSKRFSDLGQAGFAGRLARADGRPYHEAGASEAQELAAVLSTGIAYLRALEAGGCDLDTARSALSFLLVADADEFLTVAKLRAFRRLWAAVETACGLAPKPAYLAAETAWRMTTRRDPWVNLLRGTLAAFSAGIGGADSISVLPFTAALGLPDAFARRLARNTQLVLLEESNLWRVADPVAGSGAFEALTAELVRDGWRLFRELEAEGGIAASLASGALPRRLAETGGKRAAAIAVRRDPITGSSEFPNLHETPVAVLIDAPPGQTAPPGTAAAAATKFEPLPSRRDAEAYEALRDRSDARLAETGRRPAVFLANLGSPAAFTARTTFARNAFEAVGIEALANDGFPTREALIAAFRASGAGAACLCSSDEVYAKEAEATAKALREAGAWPILLAGRPGEQEAAWRAAGIDTFIGVGTNLPEVLGGMV